MAEYSIGMAGPFWRFPWAWQRTKLGWREILVAILSSAIYLVGWRRFGWGPDVRPDLWAVISACLAVLLLWALEFGWHSVRAHIEEREQAAGLGGRRSIGNHLAAVMIKRLTAEPKGKIVISHLTAHSEPERFARQLKRILTEAGWDIAGFDATFGDVATDMEISVRDSDDPSSPAAALTRLLEEQGIVIAWGRGNPMWDSDYVYLFVGDKS